MSGVISGIASGILSAALRTTGVLAAAAALVLAGAEVALAAGGGHPTPEQNLKLWIIQALGFAIVMAIVFIYGVPVLVKILRDRAQGIASEFEAIDSGRAQAIAGREQAEAELKGFERTSIERLEAATKEGARLRDLLIAEAGDLATRIQRKGRVEAEVERAKTLLESQNRYSLTAYEVAREVLSTKVSEQTHRALVQRFLADLDGMKV